MKCSSVKSHTSVATFATVAGLALICSTLASAQAAIKIPMTPDRWEAKGDASFDTVDGYPLGVMTVAKGVAVLKDFKFVDGTIEFDIIPHGPLGAGIGFRRRDDDTYEDFYLRPRPKCDTAVECIQYAPQTHGVLLWDLYPQYQSPAPVDGSKPNHIKMVISGRRMNIYVNSLANGSTGPALSIGRLEGDVLEGGILLQGPGSFANLTIAPGVVEGLTPEPVKDATDEDHRFVRNWRVSSPATLADNKEPAFAEMPEASQSGWHPVNAERGGLIDLSRESGLPNGGSKWDLAWLKTDITSEKAQTKHVSIGWTREIWVFVNGKQVFADKNPFQPPEARKAPNGRLSLENGSFDLPLQKGKNEIAVALANNFYGWGLKLHLEDMDGVKFPADNRVPAAAK